MERGGGRHYHRHNVNCDVQTLASSKTLFSAAEVAEAAGVARSTVIHWLLTGKVEHQYEIAGPARDRTPVFDKAGRDAVIRFAKDSK